MLWRVEGITPVCSILAKPITLPNNVGSEPKRITWMPSRLRVPYSAERLALATSLLKRQQRTASSCGSTRS